MKNTLLALFVFGATMLNAQTTPVSIRCGNEIFSKMIREQYPDLQDAFDATFEQARAVHATDRSPLTVNVVVHVVWKNPEENLDDSIILNQIAVLNADFNRLNADTGKLRSVFQPVAGSADIHFNLAGIVRTQTNTEFEVNLFGTNILSELKHTNQGGSDAWANEQYLNIWVCKIQPISLGGIVLGQILGFAFPPNNLGNWPPDSGAPSPEEDGVVIDFRVFGSNNPNVVEIPGGTDNLIVRGRTPVHEVGHYFGLRHIWGDGGTFGPNDCAQTDGVDDTPFANAQSEFDCDTTKNTCPKVEAFYSADMPDLIENYMDYSSEDCMNMFTQGQVDIMRNVLQGPRSGLLMQVATQNIAGQQPDFQLSPNPASARFALTFNLSEKTNVTLRMLNAAGQSWGFSTSETYPAGSQQIELDASAFTPGLYFVEMRTEGGVSVRKLVVR
ncbi:MAG TPA: M43 family zinc metalloprotease [Saprospiraceae bacterium]|nr:M43 family zinc metalloprotease [Saprospiraceae bacterium]